MTSWVGELSARASVLASAACLPILMGRFRCAPSDPAWWEVNCIGEVAHLVFPRTAVEITPVLSAPMTADAHRVLLYDPGQEYRRRLLDPRGDDCLFVALGPGALEEIGAAGSLVDRRHQRFTARARVCPASVHRSLHLLRGQSSRDHVDPLALDEVLMDVAAAVLDADPATPAGNGPDVFAEEVRAVLGCCYRDPLTLADVAAAVGMSPYHLHRRFRAATGWTIHAYRDQLRLREGLARVIDGSTDLAATAHELGYSSHSHFTARFRGAFGVTPSSLRASWEAGHRSNTTGAAG